MTDIIKLLGDFPEINPANYGDDEVNALNAWGIAAHTAIEALQGENGQLHASLQSARAAFEQVCKHRDALAAELAGLKAQEPVAFMDQWGEVFRNEADAADHMEGEPTKLYAAPKALAPLTDKEVSRLWSIAHDDTTDRMAFQVLVRLVEKHRGIGGTP